MRASTEAIFQVLEDEHSALLSPLHFKAAYPVQYSLIQPRILSRAVSPV